MLSVAQDLGKPYGIGCTGLNGAGSAILPFINFFITQTAYDIIAQAARWAQLLVYDGADGNLVLAQAGTKQMASGFAEGVNIESWNVDYNISERYSEYRCFIQSTDFLLDPASSADTDPNRITVVQDNGAGIRHRVYSFVAEAGQNYRALAQQQATWEMNRRRGRSQAVRITVDSWRDSAGKLWEPNALAGIEIPHAKLEMSTWLISEVTFRRGPDGTHADLVLMPKESFETQPSNLAQFSPAVLAAASTPSSQDRATTDGLQRRDR